MTYVKIGLSIISAFILAQFVPIVWSFKGLSQEKATGVAWVATGFIESLRSPLFWIPALVFFWGFIAASKLGSRILRILLFWIPTISLTSVGFVVAGLFAYAYFHVRSY